MAVTPLGAVINGDHPGRSGADEITLFDGTGVGLQDLAVASAVVDLALAQGVAIELNSDFRNNRRRHAMKRLRP